MVWSVLFCLGSKVAASMSLSTELLLVSVSLLFPFFSLVSSTGLTSSLVIVGVVLFSSCVSLLSFVVSTSSVEAVFSSLPLEEVTLTARI